MRSKMFSSPRRLPSLLWLISVISLTLAASQTRKSSTVPIDSSVNVDTELLHFTYELQNWIDTTKRPCDDFFSYVCNKTLNPSAAQLLQRQRSAQMRFDQFLEKKTTPQQQQSNSAELKLKQFYESCKMARSVDDLKGSLMYRLSGGWPAIDDAPLTLRRRNNSTWLNVLSAFHEVGVPYFFRPRIEIKSNKRIMHIESHDTVRYSLRKFEQLADEVMHEYAVVPGRARLVSLEVLSFERSRREIAQTNATTGSALSYTYATFKTTAFANRTHLVFDWDAYFRRSLGKPLRPNDTVVLQDPDKLQGYFLLLQNTTVTRLLNWMWLDYLMDKTSRDCQMLAERFFHPVYQYAMERSAIDRAQMARMYTYLGSAYKKLVNGTSWIDEISQLNSMQMFSRVLRVTLNDDASMDDDLKALVITNRNFYRNIEKLQRLLAQQQQQYFNDTLSSSASAMTAANQFMQVFHTTSGLLPQTAQNMSAPLNYMLVGQRFMEHLISAGSSSRTPGAWRSMDSERQFGLFEQCIVRQLGGQQTNPQQRLTKNHKTSNNNANANANANDLLLKLLARQQCVEAIDGWRKENAQLAVRLERLLAAGSLQLTLRKLYFISSLLVECRDQSLGADNQQWRTFVHSQLRNSPEFSNAFACRQGDELFVRDPCKVSVQ